MRVSFPKIFFACVLIAGGTYGVTKLRNSHAIASFDQKQQEIKVIEEQNNRLLREIEARKRHLEDLKNPEILKLEIEKRLKVVPSGSQEFIVQDDAKTPAAEPHP